MRYSLIGVFSSGELDGATLAPVAQASLYPRDGSAPKGTYVMKETVPPIRWTVRGFDLFAQELQAFVAAQQLDGRMPSRDALEQSGRVDLLEGIKEHGGFAAVAKRVGLRFEPAVRYAAPLPLRDRAPAPIPAAPAPRRDPVPVVAETARMPERKIEPAPQAPRAGARVEPPTRVIRDEQSMRDEQPPLDRYPASPRYRQGQQRTQHSHGQNQWSTSKSTSANERDRGSRQAPRMGPRAGTGSYRLRCRICGREIIVSQQERSRGGFCDTCRQY